MKSKDVIRLAERLILLDESNQKLLAETFFTGLGEEELLNWLSWLGRFVSPRSRWIEIEQWMENRFETNFSCTPRKMALICKKYLKMDPRMFPFLCRDRSACKTHGHDEKAQPKRVPESGGKLICLRRLGKTQ